MGVSSSDYLSVSMQVPDLTCQIQESQRSLNKAFTTSFFFFFEGNLNLSKGDKCALRLPTGPGALGVYVQE